MAAAKLFVLYPMPKDMAAFELAYSAEPHSNGGPNLSGGWGDEGGTDENP